MKKTLKVYFDFLCPYCYKGVKDLLSLMPEFPHIKVEWLPCEAHPRPEQADQYSDLAAEAVLYIKGHKGAVLPFIARVLDAHFQDGQRVDDKEYLAKTAELSGIDPKALKSSLIRRDYKQDVMSLNSEVWDINMFEAVPAYRCRNKELVSMENQTISRQKLKEFLEEL